MEMKSILCCALVSASALLMASDTPEVSNVSMTQASFGRKVTITYELNNAPNGAVVTLDVQTNKTGAVTANDADWVSIGGEAVCNAQGDVWKKVSQGSRTITWRPDKSWEGHKVELANGGARAVVTAWALDNTPDYMVVDISQGAQPNTQRYFPAADFVPNGVTNDLYKTTALLMRKINAGGVTWTMGSTTFEAGRSAVNEETHLVTLPSDYYIAVYETTITQFQQVKPSGATAQYRTNPTLPMEKVSYNEIRNSNVTTGNSSYQWPNPPSPISFLGLLNAKSGLDFDLPTEAQWEFAARSGHGSGYWNDGSEIDANDANLRRLACFGASEPAPVGSYAPSSWGLYDMHGNVWEWCLDWYQDNIASATAYDGQPYGGRVNIHPEHFDQYLSSAGVSGGVRVYRGGAFKKTSPYCRPACRDNGAPTGEYDSIGFRVVCTAGLQ